MSGLDPAQCTYCGKPIVWGSLQNGRRRSFDRQPVPVALVAPADRWAFSRRAGAVVNLDGQRGIPDRVLIEHRCEEYAEHREQQRIAAMRIDPDTIIEALGGTA